MVEADFEKILNKIDPSLELISARRLDGGSAQVHMLLAKTKNDNPRQMILRVHGDYDFELNPKVANQEFYILQLLARLNIPTPEPIYLDESGEFISRPFIVIGFINGRPELNPINKKRYLDQLADNLSMLHAANFTSDELSKINRHPEYVTATLKDIDVQERRGIKVPTHVKEIRKRIRDALLEVLPDQRHNTARLIHGDYWPGNVLFDGEKLSGIIDWEDSAVGDPLVDVGNARLELAWLFGPDDVQYFTERYFETATNIDPTDLWIWDLFSVFRHGTWMYAWNLNPEELVRRQKINDDITESALSP